MVGPRALLLLLLVVVLFLGECEAGKKKKKCKYNGKKYKAGQVIEVLDDNCVELKCSKKGKMAEHHLMKDCTCGKEGTTRTPPTNAPPTNAPPTNAPPPTGTSDRIFTFVNRCSQDLWMGADGRSETKPTFVFNGLNFHCPKNGGWYLPAGNTSDVSVPFDWYGGRFWARTGCTGTGNNFHCETGHCGPWIECAHGNVPRGGVPPATLAEFTLSGNNNQDYYDISLVDGFNLPMTISAVTYDNSQPNTDNYWCNNPKCLFDINSICPPELAVKVSGRTVACKSACAAFNTDEYCCRGACCGLPTTCTADKWPVNYPHEIFEAHCPEAYSYAYDDNTSTFVCRNTNYIIKFC